MTVPVKVFVMLPMRKYRSGFIGACVAMLLVPRLVTHDPVRALCTKITAPGTCISCIFAASCDCKCWVKSVVPGAPTGFPTVEVDPHAPATRQITSNNPTKRWGSKLIGNSVLVLMDTPLHC